MSSAASIEALKQTYQKGYRIIDGEVFNPQKKKLKQQLDIHGYFFFSMKINNKTRKIRIHRLVAYQKFGDRIFEQGIEVRHLNGNSTDNSEENIEIGTHSDNMLDRSETDRTKYAINASTKLRKFSDKEIQKIRERYNLLRSYKRIMIEFGIASKGTLHHILNHEYLTTK